MIRDILNNNESVTPNSKELAVLREHFPACFKKDGSFDIERFKGFLSDKVEISEDGHELNFLGKDYAKLLASIDTTTVVVPNEKHNNELENKSSENIYISSDNLDGLKHLLKSYSEKIKCIYIDPPYNTGSDGFIYNDSFDFTAENLSEKLSISEEKASRILDLTKRGSSSHSAWLMFMYPRLLLARDLLTDDGIIFISIDDNEQANLKLICDDVFGEINYITTFVWEKTQHFGRQKLNVYNNRDFILCYAKEHIKENIKELLVEQIITELEDAPLYNASNPKNTIFFPENSVVFNIDDGEYSKSNDSKYELLDTVRVQEGKNKNGFRIKFQSRWSPQKVEQEFKNGARYWVKSKNFAVRVIYPDDKTSNKAVRGIIYTNKSNDNVSKNEYEIIPGTNENGSNEVKRLFGELVFDYPKPSTLISFLLGNLYNERMSQHENDFIVLDFFSGSATTAHAAMSLNAKDNGSRKFIMIQLPEIIEEGKPAYEAGYRTIDEIGIDRIIKVGNKIKEENPNTEIDLGFKHYILQEPSTDTIDKMLEFDPTDTSLWSDKTLLDEFGKPTILKTWLVSDGYGLTKEAEEIDLSGYKAYCMKNHLYLIDLDISDEAIESLVVKYEIDANFNPENVVLFGYSFTWSQTEQLKTNLKRLKGTEKNLNINFDVRY